MLLSLVLRNTFDVYKLISLIFLLSFWMIHWLVFKRSDYLISRGSRGALEHAKILLIFFILISADLLISFFFNKKFDLESETMNEIYVIVGFEVSVSMC